jgi:hypothetical protein
MLHKVTLLKVWVLIINELCLLLKKRVQRLMLSCHFIHVMGQRRKELSRRVPDCCKDTK